MRSRFWLRTSRRGYTILEVTVASSILLLIATGTLSILSTAARLEQAVVLQRDTDQEAVKAMTWMINDVREAKLVDTINAHQFRIYLPVVRPDGHYDRYVADTDHYIQYALTDKSGRLSVSGGYLWRSTEAGGGKAVAQNIQSLTCTLQGKNALRLTVRAEKTGRGRHGNTQLNERVLYLRNY
jgi:hypothetical protein